MPSTKDATGPATNAASVKLDERIHHHSSEWGARGFGPTTERADIYLLGTIFESNKVAAKIISSYEKRLKEADLPPDLKESVKFKLILEDTGVDIEISAQTSTSLPYSPKSRDKRTTVFVDSVATDILKIIDDSNKVKLRKEEAAGPW